MLQIDLNDTEFWKWMKAPSGVSFGIEDYLRRIARHEIDTGYIVDLYSENAPAQTSQIMNNLRQCMPRAYFLEVQFCASVYATIFGRIFPPLALQVQQLAYIEWLLYTEPESLFYRDHLVHMFKVAYVLRKVISARSLLPRVAEYQFAAEHFVDWCRARRFNTKGWNQKKKEEVVMMGLFFAALFHDFGYGHFFMMKYDQRLSRLYPRLLCGGGQINLNSKDSKVLLRSLSSSFVRDRHMWLESTSSNLDNDAVIGFFRDCIALNHSIASSIFVIELAETLLKSRALSHGLYIALHIAAEACMVHDMMNEGSWIHFPKKENGHFIDTNDHKSIPVGILLIVADELSVWNRPRLNTTTNDNSKTDTLERTKVPSKITVKISERKENNEIEIRADKGIKPLEKAFNEDLLCLKSGVAGDRPRVLGYTINLSHPDKNNKLGQDY